MRAFRHALGLAMAGAPAMSLFAAQTLLLGQGRAEGVLALAQFGGLLGLTFFAFDGLSGLGPAMLRLRHPDETIRAAYRFYRLALLAICLAAFVAVSSWWPSWSLFFIAVALSLLLRLRPLDHDLDQRDLQHWAMLAQNGWMIILALSAALFGRLDGSLAGLSALIGTLPYVLLHRRQTGTQAGAPTQSTTEALRDLLALMLMQGVGQIYGRASMFALGTLAGPIATLAIYAKQIFNAAGVLLQYLRRVELRAGRVDMRLSLWGQVAIVLIGSSVVGIAAARLELGLGMLIILIGWQVAEKISATGVYAMQLANRQGIAMAALITVILLGAAGMGLSYLVGSPLPYIGLELLGFGASILFWAALHQKAFQTIRARQA